MQGRFLDELARAFDGGKGVKAQKRKVMEKIQRMGKRDDTAKDGGTEEDDEARSFAGAIQEGLKDYGVLIERWGRRQQAAERLDHLIRIADWILALQERPWIPDKGVQMEVVEALRSLAELLSDALLKEKPIGPFTPEEIHHLSLSYDYYKALLSMAPTWYPRKNFIERKLAQIQVILEQIKQSPFGDGIAGDGGSSFATASQDRRAREGGRHLLPSRLLPSLKRDRAQHLLPSFP